MLDKLRVEEGEASKLILVEVHHEQLVGGGEFCSLAGKLPVKIRHILPVSLHTTEMLKVQVDKGEAPELVPLHVVQDVRGCGIWRGCGDGQLLELGVKVFCFARVRDLWFERRLYLPGLNLCPIYHLEEQMALDLLLSLLHAT